MPVSRDDDPIVRGRYRYPSRVLRCGSDWARGTPEQRISRISCVRDVISNLDEYLRESEQIRINIETDGHVLALCGERQVGAFVIQCSHDGVQEQAVVPGDRLDRVARSHLLGD